MIITENTSERLVLRGVPGGRGAMAVVFAIGVLFVLVFGAIAWWNLRGGISFVGLMMSIGVVVGLIATLVGGDALLTHESVIIDFESGAGSYHRVHALFGGRRNERWEFGIEDIAAVVVERRVITATRPETELPDREAIQWRAILRIDNPRRTVIMAESQNDREIAIREVAIAVAQALGMPIVEDLAEGDEAEEAVVPTREFTVSLLARDRGTPLELPAPPEGARAQVDIDPESVEIRLRWRVMNGIAILVPFIVIFIGWTAAATVFFLGSIGIIGSAPWPKTPGAWVLPGVILSWVALGLVILYPLVRLALGAERVVTVSAAGVRARNPGWIDLRLVPAASITTVRVASGEDDAVLIYHSGGKSRIGIHNPVKGEVAWIAATIREAVRAMRPRHEDIGSR